MGGKGGKTENNGKKRGGKDLKGKQKRGKNKCKSRVAKEEGKTGRKKQGKMGSEKKIQGRVVKIKAGVV